MPEVRMICNLLDIAGKTYELEKAGSLYSSQGQKEYAMLNPSRCQPLVVYNKTHICADPATLAKYLCTVMKLYKLYPKDGAEKIQIDAMLEVVYLQFKRTTDRLIKLHIQKKARELEKMKALGTQQK